MLSNKWTLFCHDSCGLDFFVSKGGSEDGGPVEAACFVWLERKDKTAVCMLEQRFNSKESYTYDALREPTVHKRKCIDGIDC